MRRVLLFATLMLGIDPRLVAAGSTLPSAAVLPDALRDDVSVVVRINDPAWLVRHVDQIGAAAAPVGALLRSLLAEALFTSRGLDGIAFDRPALLAIRGDERPLLMAIPFRDRNRFLDDFGQVRVVDRFMLRLAEQQGTVVYSQNTVHGLWEYRLLLRDGYAYLARSAEECRLLADQPLAAAPDAPALVVEWTGPYLASDGARLDAPGVDPGAGMAGSLDDLALRTYGMDLASLGFDVEGLLGQIAMVRLEVGSDAAGDLRLGLACEAAAGTALAEWIGRQAGGSSRLLPMIERSNDLLTVHGQLTWRGELEEMGRDLGAALQERLGAETATRESLQDVRRYYSLLDRRGAFAATMSLPQTADGTRQPVIRAVTEQPGAADLLTLQRTVDELLSRITGAEVGAFDAVGGLVAYRTRQSAPDGSPSCTLYAAERDRLLQVTAASERAATVEMRTLIAALADPQAPAGAPGVVVARLHIDRALRLAAIGQGQPAPDLAPLTLDIALRVEAGRRMVCELVLPLGRLADQVQQVGFGAAPAAP